MGLSIGGLGSGLDIGGMTEQLVAAERTPKLQRIQAQTSVVENRLSAYGLVKSSAANFLDAIGNFQTDKAFSATKAKASDSEFLSVGNSQSSATVGEYSISVDQLAQAHKLASNTTFSEDTSFGVGDIVLSLGHQSMTVSLSVERNTLSDFVAAINQAEDNVGIQASLIKGDNGSHIRLSSSKTGVENQISIDVSNATGDITQLAFDANNPNANADVAVTQSAQDAQITLDGLITVSSTTNTFENAIDGVTFTVKKRTDVETPNVNITVSTDSKKALSGLEKIGELYNSLSGMVSSQSYSENKKAPLSGDSVTRSLMTQLRQVLNTPLTVANETRSLSQMGMSIDSQGQWQVDKDRFEEAFENDAAFADFFHHAESNVLGRIESILKPFVEMNGIFDRKEASLTSQKSALEEDKVALDKQLTAFENRTYRQLSAMDAALATMNQELNALMSLFA